MDAHYLACDLGAESGRLMLGALNGSRMTLEEVHRFSNSPERVDGSLRWNIPKLWTGLKDGFKKVAQRGLAISSISTDSWGVDYVLLDETGSIIEPVFHYRNPRTARGVETVRATVDCKNLFAETGIQFMPLNTIYQLAAESAHRLQDATQLLLIGDAFNFFLSGVSRAEESLASTTQLYNPKTRLWSPKLLRDLQIPAHVFPAIIPSGTVLGPLKEEVCQETGLAPFPVVATCSHDTGAAVAGVPAQGANWAYLSSGTWSLLGTELKEPIITDQCRELNFTNEIGYGGSVRLLKNIVGLWIVQECRRDWAEKGEQFDYATLMDLAANAPAFVSWINAADPRFVAPDNMPAKIADYCRETGQPVPQDPGAIIRCVFESLALLYRHTLDQLEQLLGHKVERLHIVGGGSKNMLLNQFTANAIQRPVMAGPVEATAIGNILVQALALVDLRSLANARELIRSSFETSLIEPKESRQWAGAFHRFMKLPQF
jgi:rhamnulokinase